MKPAEVNENTLPGKLGPKKGYKQTLAHIERRKRVGPRHHFWKGDSVSVTGGRDRARAIYRAIGPCSKCGNPRSERHHADGNTANNKPDNIMILCRRCHMQEDGRLEQLLQINQPKAAASRRKR